VDTDFDGKVLDPIFEKFEGEEPAQRTAANVSSQ
jgi:hypothetical protein